MILVYAVENQQRRWFTGEEHTNIIKQRENFIVLSLLSCFFMYKKVVYYNREKKKRKNGEVVS